MAKYVILTVTGKTVIINYSNENLEDKCPNVPEDAYETAIDEQGKEFEYNLDIRISRTRKIRRPNTH